MAGTAQELISAHHFASQQIQQQREVLLASWTELKETASKRRQLLDDSLQVQQYYTKVSEVMSWMMDKRSLVELKEYGKDEDSTQALIKKHEAIELEIEAYRASIDQLSDESKRLLGGDHFDPKVIKKREVSLTTTYSQLHQLFNHTYTL